MRKPVYSVSDQLQHKLGYKTQKMARVLTFQIYEVEGLYYIYVEKTIVLISCVVSVYAENMIYHDATHLMSCSVAVESLTMTNTYSKAG